MIAERTRKLEMITNEIELLMHSLKNNGEKTATAKPEESNKVPYVNTSRIEELKAIPNKPFDLTKLNKICEEVNLVYENGCYFATAMLVRAIVDHVPPIFEYEKFEEVANNYKCEKSFKKSMQHLNSSLRNIADGYLHIKTRNSEVLPTQQQVNFSPDLDVLLGEICRILKT